METTYYTKEDKECPHCGGEIRGHCCGERTLYYCENCGSNDKKTPPNIKLEITEDKKGGE